jgi:hypothetical protein
MVIAGGGPLRDEAVIDQSNEYVLFWKAFGSVRL